MTGISADQRTRLDTWLGPWEVLADHSWPLQDTTVLRVRSARGDYIVKMRDQIGHEVDACLRALALLPDRVPRLEHHDARAGILVTSYLPGKLVEGTPAESDPDIYRQAGELLARLQAPAEVSNTYTKRALAVVSRRIAEAEGLVSEPQLAALRERAGRFTPRPVRLCFTHGDYQPRNWVIDDGRVGVIDFGRGQDRSWVSDLVRLQNQQFTGHPERERAFMDGLGRTVEGEDAELLAIESLRQSLGTVVWAHNIRDQIMTTNEQSSQFTENFPATQAISVPSLTVWTSSIGYSSHSSKMVSTNGTRLTISLTPSNARNT